MSIPPSDLTPASWLVAAGRDGTPGAALNVPPIPASNFTIGAGRAYARNEGTPTWESLEEIVGGLESGRCVSYASGMAAVAAVFDQLGHGATVVLPDDCYQAVTGLAEAGAARHGWSVRRLPVEDTPAWVQACGEADLVWVESASNPLLAVSDLAAIGAAPRRAGTLLAVDATFATPLNQRPLDLGADVSIHSATKYIGGHSDLMAGVATTRDDALHESLRTSRVLLGGTPGTLEAFLAVRGARTLALRLEQAQATAMDLATRLDVHPAVERVRYPGLASHPSHGVASRVLGGGGTMISFDVRGGAAPADAVCHRVQLVHHATSLGAVESTIERRAAIAGQEHLPPGLLRLSVGIEDPDDLWRDLSSALTAATA